VALVLKASAERTIPARRRTDLQASRVYGKPSRSPYCCTLLLYAPSELSPLGAFCLVELRGLEPLTPCLQSRCSSS
jgi:hypothetical protein